MLYQLGLGFSIIAGIMAIVLFYLGLNHGKKGRDLMIWAVLFLGASFGGLEWAFYLLGYNMFTFFVFPLIAYFAIWFAFIIWAFEKIGERRIWIIFLVALIVLTIVAMNCMNCVRF